jgi:PAS domain S-box-containing protein
MSEETSRKVASGNELYEDPVSANLKPVEQRLLRANIEHEALLELIPAMVWYKDTHNRIMRANRRAAESINKTVAEVEGQSTYDLYPEEAEKYYQDDLEVITSGQPKLGIVELYRTASGEKRWVQTDKVPYRNAQGSVMGVLVLAQDISERRRAEEALRESEQHLRTALAAGQMGAWHIDLVTGSVTWDERHDDLFGVMADQVPKVLDQFYSLVHPADRERVMAAVAASRVRGQFSEEFRILRPDGSFRWINGQGTLLTDCEGKAIDIIGVNTDITKQKEAQFRLENFANELERQVVERTSKLLESQEQLRALATELTLTEHRERLRFATQLHDHLQQLLVLCKLKLKQGKRLVESIPSGAALIEEMDETMSNALAYSRSLVAELSPPMLREFGLVASIEWLAEWMQKMNLAVTVEVQEEPITLPEAQAVLLFQSVRELLINASKYSGIGHATVRLNVIEEHLTIEVQDQGAGFDLHAATAPALPSGDLSSRFGLFSIRERMIALGGSLEMHSAVGKGTHAILRLPFVGPPPSGKTTHGEHHDRLDKD